MTKAKVIHTKNLLKLRPKLTPHQCWILGYLLDNDNYNTWGTYPEPPNHIWLYSAETALDACIAEVQNRNVNQSCLDLKQKLIDYVAKN